MRKNLTSTWVSRESVLAGEDGLEVEPILERLRQRSFAKSGSSESKKHEDSTGRNSPYRHPCYANFADVGDTSRSCEIARVWAKMRWHKSGGEGEKIAGRKEIRERRKMPVTRHRDGRLSPVDLAPSAVILILLRVSQARRIFLL